MSNLSLEKQEELAARIMQLVVFVGLLTPDEVESLKELRQNLQESNGTMNAVAGILAPLEEANHKVSRQQAMIKRIDAFIALHESGVDLQQADEEFKKAKDGQAQVNRLFGL